MEILLVLLVAFGTLSCATRPETQAARTGVCQDYQPTCLGSLRRCEVNRDGCRTCTCDDIFRSPTIPVPMRYPGE